MLRPSTEYDIVLTTCIFELRKEQPVMPDSTHVKYMLAEAVAAAQMRMPQISQ